MQKQWSRSTLFAEAFIRALSAFQYPYRITIMWMLLLADSLQCLNHQTSVHHAQADLEYFAATHMLKDTSFWNIPLCNRFQSLFCSWIFEPLTYQLQTYEFFYKTNQKLILNHLLRNTKFKLTSFFSYNCFDLYFLKKNKSNSFQWGRVDTINSTTLQICTCFTHTRQYTVPASTCVTFSLIIFS